MDDKASIFTIETLNRMGIQEEHNIYMGWLNCIAKHSVPRLAYRSVNLF